MVEKREKRVVPKSCHEQDEKEEVRDNSDHPYPTHVHDAQNSGYRTREGRSHLEWCLGKKSPI